MLKVIYCDNSGVTINEANNFMLTNPHTLVIYNSQELIKLVVWIISRMEVYF